MEENRFFKTVWRINSLGLLCVSLGMLFIVGMVLTEEFFRPGGQGEIITNVAPDPEGEEKWRLGYSRKVSGTPYVLVPLISEKEYVRLRGTGFGPSASHSYGKGGLSSPTRNVLVVDGEKNEQRWLFPTNEQLITEIEQLKDTDCTSDRKTMALQYVVVKRDTNRDEKLSGEDLSAVAFSRVDGSGYREVVTEADSVLASHLVNNDKTLLIYQRKGVGFSATVDLGDFTVISSKELPMVKESL